MSSPTSCLPFPPSNAILQPLYFQQILPIRTLTATSSYLAHFAFHPTVEDRLPKFPTISEFERGYFAFRDVTVQGIRGNPQILRRLSYVHHFARFTHEERHPGAEQTPK